MSIIRTIGRTIIANRATIATVAGVVGVCGAGVLACRATYKEATVSIQETKMDLEIVKESAYTDEKAYNKAIKNVYLDAVKDMCKIYAPSVGLGILSVGAILYGHKSLRAQHLMVAGAYKALTNDFDHYRDKVKAFVGDEKERNISTMKRPPKVVEVENPETGKLEEEIEADLEDIPTDRSVFIDECSQLWRECNGNPEELKRRLIKLQDEFTKELNDPKGRGYILLNDVYKALDVPETYAGSCCGWVRGLGDDRVDFGIFNLHSQAARRFVNGLEDIILLTFNDEGYILDKI